MSSIYVFAFTIQSILQFPNASTSNAPSNSVPIPCSAKFRALILCVQYTEAIVLRYTMGHASVRVEHRRRGLEARHLPNTLLLDFQHLLLHALLHNRLPLYCLEHQYYW